MKSAHVLVVDDESQIVEIVLRALAQRGHLGKGVESAEAAEAALSSSSFDLVLLDHVLGGQTGMQAIGKLSSLTKAPIYLMSAYTGDETRTDVLLLGAAGFLPKPLDVAGLFALLDALPDRA